eukprot:scaffold266041_cov43-Prasinocladus_malaysianus.AAC.2
MAALAAASLIIGHGGEVALHDGSSKKGTPTYDAPGDLGVIVKVSVSLFVAVFSRQKHMFPLVHLEAPKTCQIALA